MTGISRSPGWRTLRRLEIALVVFATLRSAWLLLRAEPWTADDAFIVARYAENLVRDGVLSFNVTGPRVEGFTSPLFALVATLATAAGVSAITAMKACGIAAHLGLGAAILALGRALKARPPASGLVALVCMSMAEHLTHAGSGLETEVFVLVCLLSTAACVRLLTFTRRRAWSAALLLLVTALTRPEGLAVAGVLLSGLAARHFRATPPIRRHLTKSMALGLVLPLTLLTLARWAYFGAFLPNTFYAKLGAWSFRHVADSLELVAAYFADVGLVALALLVAARALGRTPGAGPRRRFAGACALSAFAVCAVLYARADLVMNYASRFAFHTLPWIVVGALIVCDRAAAALPRLWRRPPVVAWAVAALGLSLWALSARGARVEAKLHVYRVAYMRVLGELHAPLAQWIESHLAKDDKVAFYPDAGYIPYRTQRFAIDFGKLNDPYLARHARGPEDVVRYFMQQSPAALVIARNSEGELWDAGAKALLANADFQERYALVEQRGDPRGATLSLYARRR